MPLNPTAWFDIAGRNRSQRTFHEVKQGLDGIRKSGISLGRALNFGIGFGSLSSFAVMAKGAASFSAELTNNADKLQVSTDFLQSWAYAADRFDVSANTAYTALQRFGRRIGQAAEGTGELAKGLEKLGISVFDSAGRIRSTESILADYADGVKNAASAQEQLLLSNQAFDSEGVALVSVLRQGSEGLAKFQDEAKKAGRVLDEDVAKSLANSLKYLEDFQRGLTIFSGNIVGSVMGETPEARNEARTGVFNKILDFIDFTSGLGGQRDRPWRPGDRVRRGAFPGLRDVLRQAELPNEMGPMYFPNRSSEVGAYQEYMRNQGKTNEFLRRIAENTDRLAKENPGATYAR